MKITRISLQGFRAFDEPFELNLNDGKNLLLYGENGSGKSSIYLALKRFFEERGDDVDRHRNCFSPANRLSYVRIQLRGTDADGIPHDHAFHWDVASGHPLPVPQDPDTAPVPPELRSILVDGARRSGFLDYRAMLRTHLLAIPLPRSHDAAEIHNTIYGTEAQGLERQLFDLISRVVLSGVRTTISGGTQTTLGELIHNVWTNRPANRRRENLQNANHHANVFNHVLNAKLPELQSKLNEFLSEFENHMLEICLLPASLAWDRETLTLTGAEIVPEVTFRGQSVTEFQSFLNEARLSAMALCLFFAGVVLSDNDFDNPAHPRFLFLDDALIGLELQNRLPILRILTSEAFRQYQIFLLTHDRVWYDLARSHLPENNGWLHQQLLADEAGGRLVPRLKPCPSDLTIAQTHLDNNDLKAAAVYARAAFESRIQKVCEKYGIEVNYRRDPNEVTLDKLWSAIVARQTKREEYQTDHPNSPDFISRTLIDEVNVMRSNVLNALSHADAPGLNSAEVRAAIETVVKLQQHPFPPPNG